MPAGTASRCCACRNAHDPPFAAFCGKGTPYETHPTPAALAAGILALALLLGGCAPAAALTSPSAAGRSPLDWPRPRQDGGQDWFDQWFGSWYGGSGLTQPSGCTAAPGCSAGPACWSASI